MAQLTIIAAGGHAAGATEFLMSYKKRLAILVCLIAGLLAYFWLASRYPSIDQKAAMAGEVVMGDVLSFEASFPVTAADPLWHKILYSTLNWIMTNRQGMTFGVLLASLVLTLLQYRRTRTRSRNVFKDVLKGVLIGTPLGVCVNCAAPIAFGMRSRGMSPGTSLATMFASPSLNIIVLTMTFSLLPLYMAVTKVAATLLFLLILLPVLIRRYASHDLPVAESPPMDRTSLASTAGAETWAQAVTGLARDFWKNFLFIVVRTVPLMLLAGLLGAAMANLVPLESISGWHVTVLAMLLVALLGTFAPVPIAFDVIVVQALLAAGLPGPFAMVLLLTLGLYSIYPMMLVSRFQSFRFAMQLFFGVATLGFACGYVVGFYEDYSAIRDARIFQQRIANKTYSKTSAAPPLVAGAAAMTLPASGTEPTRLRALYQQDDIQVLQARFQPRSPSAPTLFTHHPGKAYGLQASEPQVLDFMLPFSQGRGMAAGDYNADGWPDLVVAQNQGIMLYRNVAGQRFEPQPAEFPGLSKASILLVAFVDMDDDGCLDLFAGAFGAADFIVNNDCRGFDKPRVVELPHESSLMTQAASFADIDRDRDLDLLKGNWFFLIPRTAPSQRAINYIASNQGGLKFRQYPLQEIHGETLTVLWSDLDLDGWADMVIGNDYMEPDIFYQGLGRGEFRQMVQGGAVPITTNATMSIDTADFDNDLDLDIFLSGKVNDFGMRRHPDGNQPASLEEQRGLLRQHRKQFQQDYCALTDDAVSQAACRQRFVIGDILRRSTLDACSDLQGIRRQDECIITLQIKNALVRREWSFCPQIPAAFPVHREMCDAYAAYDAAAVKKEPNDKYLDQGAIDQKDQGNVLLVRQPDGSYQDRAGELGVLDAFWAWNARFADLDLDGWQDLYVVNGWWLETSMYSNAFYHNESGQRFEERAQAVGLVNYAKQHAFVYLDFDGDGDLDIVSRSLSGDLDMYINNAQGSHAITFEFSDQRGNHFGIGNHIIVTYGDAGERRQLREIKAGGGFVSFDPPVAHFGLGQFDQLREVQIDWSDGSLTVLDQPLAAGHRYVIERAASTR